MNKINYEKDFMNAWDVLVEPYTSLYHDSMFLVKQEIRKLKKNLNSLIGEK